MDRPTSPLVAVGMQYVTDMCDNLVTEDMQKIEQSLTMFLQNQLSFKECAQVYVDILNTKKPLNRIFAILQIPDNPIPDSFGLPFAGRNGKNHHWTDYEDRRLLAGIHRFGVDNWKSVANFVGNGRSRSQCMQRWSRGLNPAIRKDKWTKEEEQLLLSLVKSNKYKSWSAISSCMRNRSDVQCRYRYKQMMGFDKEPLESSGRLSPSGSEPSEVFVNQRMKVLLPPIAELITGRGGLSGSLSNGSLLDNSEFLGYFQ